MKGSIGQSGDRWMDEWMEGAGEWVGACMDHTDGFKSFPCSLVMHVDQPASLRQDAQVTPVRYR